MLNFIVLQHLDIESPALIAEVLAADGHQLTTIHCDQGDALPVSMAGIDGVVIMGGPASANDASMQQELAWVEAALDRGVPMLGICLGAQVMARAVGARIMPSPVRELGWFPVMPTAESAGDSIFCSMPDALPVFQWHGETFTITDAMHLVATNPQVPAQAFRLANAQYGLQFHIEIDTSIIASWIAYGASERTALGHEGIALLHKDTARYLNAMHGFCRQLVQAWLNEVALHHPD